MNRMLDFTIDEIYKMVKDNRGHFFTVDKEGVVKTLFSQNVYSVGYKPAGIFVDRQGKTFVPLTNLFRTNRTAEGSLRTSGRSIHESSE